jgi:hypothetical protein
MAFSILVQETWYLAWNQTIWSRFNGLRLLAIRGLSKALAWNPAVSSSGLYRMKKYQGSLLSGEKPTASTVNRRDLIAVPIPDASLLWRNLRVRDVSKVEGRQHTQNIRIDIILEGISENKFWKCGLEFDYANEESFYCRPLRLRKEGKQLDAGLFKAT